GEWSLGVALVMEVWGGRSRAFLAGLIGAAANVGYMLVALLSLGLGSFRETLASWGLSPSWREWRLLMVCGALPALLTFFVRSRRVVAGGRPGDGGVGRPFAGLSGGADRGGGQRRLHAGGPPEPGPGLLSRDPGLLGPVSQLEGVAAAHGVRRPAGSADLLRPISASGRWGSPW